MKQPDYPKTLELYRDDMLCLTVDVEKASKLLLVENWKVGPFHRVYTDAEAQRLVERVALRKGNTQGAI